MGKEPSYLVKAGLVDEYEIAICISIAFLIFLFFHTWRGVYVATCDLIKLQKSSVYFATPTSMHLKPGNYFRQSKMNAY